MSKDLVFATDIDGCVLKMNDLFADYFSEKYKTCLRYEDITDYNIENLIEGITKDEVREAFYDIIDQQTLEVEDQSKEVLSWVSELSKRVLIFITSRNPKLGVKTYDNLNKFFNDMDFVVFHEQKETRKSDYINKYGINLFIEDNLDTALDIVANTNCKVLLRDRPWNRHINIKSFKNLERVFNWIQVRDFIYANYNC